MRTIVKFGVVITNNTLQRFHYIKLHKIKACLISSLNQNKLISTWPFQKESTLVSYL